MPTAIITGASRGLGLALARALAERGWRLVIDARERGPLEAAARELSAHTEVVALPGDVADDWHRAALVAAPRPRGRRGPRAPPARKHRQRPRPEPPAVARDLPAGRARTRLPDQRP